MVQAHGSHACVLFQNDQLFAALWTAAHQALLSIEFSRQEYWSGLPFASPGDLPDPGIEPRSPALQVDSLLLHRLVSPGSQVWSLTPAYLYLSIAFLCCACVLSRFRHEILQARILEWIAMPSSRESSRSRDLIRSHLMSSVLAGGFFSTSSLAPLGSPWAC